LFYDILNVEFNMWSWTRNMCKYGDFFLRLEISPEYGIHLVHPISPYELTRVEGSDPKNLNYVKYQHDGMGGGMEYENFEIAHFRLLSDSNFLPYGKSMIEPARRVWKQLSLMEDAMLIHRIMKAPEKRIFSIDVGNIAPSEVDAAMQKIAREFNLSETVFLLPPRDPVNTARARIFTPTRELPFAGHPTIGAAVLIGLTEAQGLMHGQDILIALEEEVGVISCTVGYDRNGIARASFTLPKLPIPAGQAGQSLFIAQALGLEESDIGFGAQQNLGSSAR
jgi:hypothetical protein